MEIWRFVIEMSESFTIEMPKDAEILTVQTKGPISCIWAKVDPDAETEQRRFGVFGTGHKLPDSDKTKYIGTFQPETPQIKRGMLIFHLFERNR